MANFKIVAANSIDPANGESLCALGNHIINGYNGVLTAKAINNPKHNNFLISKLI